jgi:hypothetical protein
MFWTREDMPVSTEQRFARRCSTTVACGRSAVGGRDGAQERAVALLPTLHRALLMTWRRAGERAGVE